MIPTQSYIRKDIVVTVVLLAGVLLLGAFRPQHSMSQMQVQLEGVLNEMGGSEFTPQMSPTKPFSTITLKPATDDGWDVTIALTHFLRGGFDQPNPMHLGVGYPYLIVDGHKIGRFYQDTLHLPELTDGEHIISVYYELPVGGLYRLFGTPIGNSLYITVKGDHFVLAEL